MTDRKPNEPRPSDFKEDPGRSDSEPEQPQPAEASAVQESEAHPS